MPGESDIQALFQALERGDADAREHLSPRVQEELYRLACGHMARQRPSHTLQATALVNEVYLRLRGGKELRCDDHGQFLSLVSTMMRQILVDHARRKATRKRELAGERVALDGLVDELERRSGSLLALDRALDRLREKDPKVVRLIELRFFGGRSMAEAAQAVGLTRRTAERRWRVAKLMLRRELGE
ncbi:MAG: ECF-type sigma factor [Planctomycetota bacterium]